MARGFHAVLKTLSDHEVELLFDDALWNGSKTLKNVRVELYERDRTLGTPRGRTVDDALGTVFVDLKQGPPNKHGSPTVEISAARFEPPAIKKVHSGAFDLVVGPEKFRVAVFMDPEEWKASMPPPWAYEKRNFIELGLDISMSEKLEYSSRRVDVRPDRLRALRGPVLTIIVQPPAKNHEDKDDFSDNAEVYWTSRSDRIVRKKLDAISLDESIDIVDQEIGFDVVWFQVNIVTHGGLGGVYMPLRRGESIQGLTAVDVNSLKVRKVRQLSSNFSHVVIRGCTVGRDKQLLQALSEQFAGVRVLAPKTHILAYCGGAKNGGMKELLYRRFWAFRPGDNKNVRPSEMARLLEEQKESMPTKPTRPFDVIVSKEFNRRSEDVPLFFRRSVDLQKHVWDFPGEGSDDAIFSAEEIKENRDRITGKEAFRKFLSSKEGALFRAELTKPDHVPLKENDPLWKDLEAWTERGHWKLTHSNMKNVVVNAGAENPIHRVRGRVTVSRVIVQACELETDITDLDVTEHPEFGSS